jgi:hypothetical protein
LEYQICLSEKFEMRIQCSISLLLKPGHPLPPPPHSHPICRRDAWPKWQIILPLKFSIFCYILSTLMDCTPPHVLVHFTPAPSSVIPRGLHPSAATTQRNGIKSTCHNVFHLIYLTLLYDPKDLLSGVVEPSDAVWLNLGTVRQDREEHWPACHLGGAGSYQDHAAQAAKSIGHDGTSRGEDWKEKNGERNLDVSSHVTHSSHPQLSKKHRNWEIESLFSRDICG